DQIMGNVNKSIEGTSFLMGDTAQVASVMLSSGIKPGQELQDTLSRVADSAAHSGVSMGEMGSIWSKVAARGHVDGEVMAQLMDRGIGLQQKLADQMGVTKEEVTDMISSGKVSFEDFSNAMNDMFDGAAQKQRETFKGSFDTMKAFRSQVTEQFEKPFYDGLIPVFNAMSEGFQQIKPVVGEFAENLSEKITPVFEHLADDVIPKMFDVIESIDFNSIIDSLSPLQDLASQAGPYVEELADAALQLVSAIAPALPPIVGALAAIAVGSLPIITDLIRVITPIISGVIVPTIAKLGDEMQKHPGLAAAAAGGFMTWAKVIAPITRGFKAFKAGGDIIASFGPKLGPAIKG
ncbi:tape measure protein, partial [Corynebacterium sp. MSK071]|uniref:tape measure protein n=1 Tax=Corynebacterium sp. MSK071 TaxID=3377090 RepID=UPI00254E3A83